MQAKDCQGNPGTPLNVKVDLLVAPGRELSPHNITLCFILSQVISSPKAPVAYIRGGEKIALKC